MSTLCARLRGLLSSIDHCLRILDDATLRERYFPLIFIDLTKRYEKAICGLRLLVSTFSKTQMEDVDDEFVTELDNFVRFLCDCEEGLVLTDDDLEVHACFPRNGPLCADIAFGRRIAEDKILEKIGMLRSRETQQHIYKALVRYHSQLEKVCDNPRFPDRSPYGRLLQDTLERSERDLAENLLRHQAEIDAFEHEILSKDIELDIKNDRTIHPASERSIEEYEALVDSVRQQHHLRKQVELERGLHAIVQQILKYWGLVR